MLDHRMHDPALDIT